MPYIQQANRDKFITTMNVLPHIANAGELNYLLTKIVLHYLRQHGLSYRVLNDIIGAFVAAKDEFTCRIIAPYEAWKSRDNGDVYPVVVKNVIGNLILEDRS